MTGPQTRQPVFADVDTGVDDAMALAYLLASPDAELVGIASTAGNVPVEQVSSNNLRLLDLFDAADIPVSTGAAGPLSIPLRTCEDTHGPEGLGYATLPAGDRVLTEYDAAHAWVKAARTHPGELIGLATGPLTNLALAMRLEPALPRLLRRLVIMGGAFRVPGNITPAAEAQIARLMTGKGAAGLRIGLKKGGCAGMEYTMELAQAADKADEVVEQGEARVLIAPMAQMFLFGTQIDYETSLLEAGFKFNNPNVAEACGCGESIKFKDAPGV